MENITIGQIVASITCLTVLAGFFIAIFKFYKTNFLDKFIYLENKIILLEKRMDNQETEMSESVEERLMLLRGLLACLDGLKQNGANGLVTKTIDEINEYLINKTHHN